MLTKSVFYLQAKMLCPAAASSVVFRPKKGPGPEKVKHLSAKMQIYLRECKFDDVFLKVSSPFADIYREIARGGIRLTSQWRIQDRHDPTDKSVWEILEFCFSAINRTSLVSFLLEFEL